MAVNTQSSNKNQVMIQKESGLRTSHRRKPWAIWGLVCSASNMNAATTMVGTRATQTSKTARKMQNATTTLPRIRSFLVVFRSQKP
jgi:hypothetical protein